MRLETKRLILRKYKKSDWKDLVEGIGDLKVSRMLTKVPYPYKRKDAEEYIKEIIKKDKQRDKDDYVFVVELKSERKLIGAVGLHRIDFFSGIATTGSWINKNYWRKGYATEAKVAVNDFAFDKLKLRKLNSEVFSDNKASNKTQLKIGYKPEGFKRKAVKSKATGKIHNENIYGLLKEDWRESRKKLIKKFK